MTRFCLSAHLPHRKFLFSTAITSAFMILTGCQTVTHTNNLNASSLNSSQSAVVANTAPVPSALSTQSKLTPAVQTVIGDYATDSYDKRQQGYDWVGVMVRPFGEAEIDIKVRARGDIKNPSCSYEGKATLMGQDLAHGVIFQTVANNSVTFLQFKDGKLTIDSQDKTALNYFCSGGDTLAGDYQKLASQLVLS
ncbi:hypothetical protein [Psychrobacter urativorans]|uniref:Lipoprotein n=1 Tax=Psychrobacter urativorans TaxID=45610 RepID=A0A0M4U5F5_9GAMM|nr:hypothetical protein [Psychrobacter urativorans]ALF58926.1 hypothetical protein AOC03_01735 [Psychrobacter urativorans]